jgi:hypothetical protein
MGENFPPGHLFVVFIKKIEKFILLYVIGIYP